MDQIVRTATQLGAAIRRWRRREGLSQTRLGARVGLRQATVSKLENGDAGTQLRTVLDALNALDLEIVVRPRSKASVQDIDDIF